MLVVSCVVSSALFASVLHVVCAQARGEQGGGEIFVKCNKLIRIDVSNSRPLGAIFLTRKVGSPYLYSPHGPSAPTVHAHSILIKEQISLHRLRFLSPIKPFRRITW